MWPQFTLQAHGIILDPQLTALWGTAGMVVLAGFIFILGCCLGSFANACAMRLVRDEDFILSASAAAAVTGCCAGTTICPSSVM